MQVNGRDENGRFKKGHTGNPNGRPPKQREQRYYEIALNACTFKDWRIIWKKAIEQAKDGDKHAREWLTDYLIGKAPQRHELSGLDGGPIKTEDVSELPDAARLAAIASLCERVSKEAGG